MSHSYRNTIPRNNLNSEWDKLMPSKILFVFLNFPMLLHNILFDFVEPNHTVHLYSWPQIDLCRKVDWSLWRILDISYLY